MITQAEARDAKERVESMAYAVSKEHVIHKLPELVDALEEAMKNLRYVDEGRHALAHITKLVRRYYGREDDKPPWEGREGGA